MTGDGEGVQRRKLDEQSEHWWRDRAVQCKRLQRCTDTMDGT